MEVQDFSKLWYLKRINLLAGLSEDEIKYIDGRSRMKKFKKGETIYFSHSDVRQIYFLKKGKVKLYKTDASGKEMVFAMLKDKECFGSLSPLEGSSPSEYAEAIEDVITCVIDKKLFFPFIEDKPNLVLRLNKMLSLKVYELEVMLEELTFKTVIERLVSLLVKLNEKFGARYKGSDMIDIPLTHNDIASMIGSTRESTTLALNKLKSLDLIDSTKKRIIIKDIKKLQDFSER